MKYNFFHKFLTNDYMSYMGFMMNIEVKRRIGKDENLYLN